MTQFPNKLIRFPIKSIREGFGSILTICLKTARVKEWQYFADLPKANLVPPRKLLASTSDKAMNLPLGFLSFGEIRTVLSRSVNTEEQEQV